MRHEISAFQHLVFFRLFFFLSADKFRTYKDWWTRIESQWSFKILPVILGIMRILRQFTCPLFLATNRLSGLYWGSWTGFGLRFGAEVRGWRHCWYKSWELLSIPGCQPAGRRLVTHPPLNCNDFSFICFVFCSSGQNFVAKRNLLLTALFVNHWSRHFKGSVVVTLWDQNWKETLVEVVPSSLWIRYVSGAWSLSQGR
jgi:hypothetical protein